jgi:hypothetical protein
MKITGYQQSIDTGGTAQATVKTVGNTLAYGTDGSGLTAMSKAAGQWAAAIEQQHENEDKENILNAMDIFNKSRYNIMYNEESGLMNTKLEGSAGIGQSYSEQIDKARADVLGNIKLHSRKNQLALDHLMYNSAREGFQTVDRWQTKQHEAVIDLRYGNNMQNYTEFAQKNWSDGQLLDNAIQGAKLTTDMIYGKRGKEFVEAKTRESVGAIVAGAVDASITHGDYNNSRKLLDQYGSLLNANQRAAFEKAIYTKEEGAFESDLAKRLAGQYGDDEEAVRAALAKEYAYSGNEGNGNIEQQAEGTSWVRNSGVSFEGVKPQVTTGLSDIAKQFQDMSGTQLIVTSGTDSTNIHAAGAHSHGAGVKLDVAADWLENADNRRKYISYLESKGIKVLDEYSNPSPNSTGGHLDLDFTDYKGGGGAQKRLLNHDEQERILQDYRREVAANKRIKQYQETQLYNTIKQDIFGMLQNGTSLSDAIAWAEAQAGSDVDRYVSYTNAVKSIYGAGGNSTSGSRGEKLGSIGKDALLDMLGSGAFTGKNKAYFMAYAANHGATNKEMDALDKGWDDWLNGAGQFAYNWNNLAKSVMGKNNDANIKAGLIKGGKNFVRVYREQHKGMNPDESLILEQMNKDITDKVWGSYSQHRDWLPDINFQIKGNNALMYAAGIASVEKVGDDWYHVVWADGTDGNINGGYLDELINGGH